MIYRTIRRWCSNIFTFKFVCGLAMSALGSCEKTSSIWRAKCQWKDALFSKIIFWEYLDYKVYWQVLIDIKQKTDYKKYNFGILLCTILSSIVTRFMSIPASSTIWKEHEPCKKKQRHITFFTETWNWMLMFRINQRIKPKKPDVVAWLEQHNMDSKQVKSVKTSHKKITFFGLKSGFENHAALKNTYSTPLTPAMPVARSPSLGRLIRIENRILP